MADEYMFQDEQWPAPNAIITDFSESSPPWKILVADDENDIHEVTLLVLKHFQIAQRPLQIISAFNELQAQQQLQQHPDIAVAIIDMVMDCEHSGMHLCEYIREKLCNQDIRIVLRSGQSGQMIDINDIERFDISDYKQKTELTTARLKSLCYFMINAFQQTMLISIQRKQTERLIAQTANIHHNLGFYDFANTLCQQMLVTLQLPCQEYLLYSQQHCRSIFVSELWKQDNEQRSCEQQRLLDLAVQSHNHQYQPPYFAAYSHSFRGGDYVFLLKLPANQLLNESDKQLIIEFNNHITIALENITPT